MEQAWWWQSAWRFIGLDCYMLERFGIRSLQCIPHLKVLKLYILDQNRPIWNAVLRQLSGSNSSGHGFLGLGFWQVDLPVGSKGSLLCLLLFLFSSILIR